METVNENARWMADNLLQRKKIMEHLRELKTEAHVVVACEIIDVAEQQMSELRSEYRDELLKTRGARILTHNLGGQVIFGHLRGGARWLEGHKVSHCWVVLLPEAYQLVDAIRQAHAAFARYSGPKSSKVDVSRNY